jgi:hypothetical protein
VFTPGDEHDLLAVLREASTEHPTDSSGAEHHNPHRA